LKTRLARNLDGLFLSGRLRVDRDKCFAEIVRFEIAELAPSAHPIVSLVREVYVQLGPPTSRTLMVCDLLQ
jgi:hypothetical protein